MARSYTPASSLDPDASSQGLLYLSDNGTGDVYVYSYPQSRLVSTLKIPSGNALGECVDSVGDVFVTAMESSGGSMIYEFAHGGTNPIETLSDPGQAYGCAIDSKSGNLAVTNGRDEHNPYYQNAGDVAVYAGARGQPTMYYVRNNKIQGFRFCGYDNDDNLYLSAVDSYHSNNDLLRLSNGSSSFETISLPKELYGWSPVQWDGKHITVSSDPSVRSRRGGPISIYRLRISASSATILGTTELNSEKNHYEGQLWIQGNTVTGVGAYARGYENAFLWPYPNGGKPRRTIKRVGYRGVELFGVTVSVAGSR